MLVEVFVDDYMKLKLPDNDGDFVRYRAVILKKIE